MEAEIFRCELCMPTKVRYQRRIYYYDFDKVGDPSPKDIGVFRLCHFYTRSLDRKTTYIEQRSAWPHPGSRWITLPVTETDPGNSAAIQLVAAQFIVEPTWKRLIQVITLFQQNPMFENGLHDPFLDSILLAVETAKVIIVFKDTQKAAQFVREE
jgi:hypothetical protein